VYWFTATVVRKIIYVRVWTETRKSKSRGYIICLPTRLDIGPDAASEARLITVNFICSVS
jgi:hypothetical protein